MTKLAIELARNKAAEAISSGRAIRFIACSPAAHSFCALSPAMGVSTPPGKSALALMPLSP
ncbi:hypothetical protein D9M70_591230 [compost metagenome]